MGNNNRSTSVPKLTMPIALPARKLCAILTLGFLTSCAGQALVSRFDGGYGELVPTVADRKNHKKVEPGALPYALPAAFIGLVISSSPERAAKEKVDLVNWAPDPDARFTLTIDESSTSHDDIDMSVNGNGLLQSINSTVEDRTPEIVDTAFKLIGNVLQLRAGLTAKADTAEAFHMVLLVDPFNEDSVSRFKRELSPWAVAIDPKGGHTGDPEMDSVWGRYPVSFKFLNGYDVEPIGRTERRQIARRCSERSVCYRPLVPVLITVKMKAGETLTKLALLPDPRRVAGYNVTRGECIKKITNLTFTNGSLTKVDLDKPSQVEHCLKIPLDVTTALLALPGELTTIKVNNLTQDNNILKQQIALIENQNKLAQLLAQQQSSQ